MGSCKADLPAVGRDRGPHPLRDRLEDRTACKGQGGQGAKGPRAKGPRAKGGRVWGQGRSCFAGGRGRSCFAGGRGRSYTIVFCAGL